MLLAEDLLLLLLDDKSGKWTIFTGLAFWEAASYASDGVAGALLVELALGGHVEPIPRPDRKRRKLKVRATDAPPPSDPALVSALAHIAAEEYGVMEILTILDYRWRDYLLARLVAAGILRREDYTGWRPSLRQRWPVHDSRHKDDLLRHMGDVLIRRLDPDPRTAGLITLRQAVGGLKIDREGIPSRQYNSRLREVERGAGWAALEASSAIAYRHA